MTGTAWLHSYTERTGTGSHVRRAMEARIRRKVRALSPDECGRILEGFGSLNGTGSTDLQVRWVGTSSQALDHFLRLHLGRRAGLGGDR